MLCAGENYLSLLRVTAYRLPFYDVMRKVTSVCLVPSSWPLGHPHSERHVSNLRCPTAVESRPARNIYNVPQIIIIVMYG